VKKVLKELNSEKFILKERYELFRDLGKAKYLENEIYLNCINEQHPEINLEEFEK